MRDINTLTGLEKASILLISMGTSVAAEVFKHLGEMEIEKLSAQIMKLRDVDQATTDAVMAEFEQVCGNMEQSMSGGKDFAAEVLQQVVGGDKAAELLERASGPSYGRPFESLWELDSGRISRVLIEEHPQIIALVLTNLPADKSASVLAELPMETQAEVAHRICLTDGIDSEVIRAVEEALQEKLALASTQTASAGGPKALVEILNNATRTTERNVLESLASQDPEVGEQVRKMMFVFEDLSTLDDRTIQVILREIDQEDLRLAVKSADDTIRNLMFKNMSERAAEMLKEDLELLTNARPEDMEAAQQRIVLIVRRLLANGEAALRSDSSDEAREPVEDTTILSDEQLAAQMAAEMGMADTQTSEEQTGGESDQEQLAA